MSIEHHMQGDILVLRPIGRLDSSSAPDLERLLKEQLGGGVKRVLFDFADLDYISSAGLRVVLLAGKGVRSAQGKMVLSGMRDMVLDVFEMSGFLTLFAAAADVDQGLGRF